MKILFICRGNVARSQIAEALFNKFKKGDHEVFSAGTSLSGPEQPIGELTPAIKEVLDVMKEEGIDVSGNLRKQVNKEMVDNADKVILVTDQRDPIPDYLINNSKVVHWDVPDPKGQSLEFTREVKDKIKEFVISSNF